MQVFGLPRQIIRNGRAASRLLAVYDPVAKWTFGHVATKASAHAARALLEKVAATAPFSAIEPRQSIWLISARRPHRLI